MKMTVDIKSALLGLIVGVGVMCVVGSGTPSSEIGRYQISAGNQGCAFIVDTKSGQAWAFQPLNTAQWKNDANFWSAK